MSVRGNTDQNCSPWRGKIVAACMSLLTTGGPGKKHGTNKLPPSRRIRERSKGERRRQSICPTNLPEFFLLESILAERCVHHQEGLPEWERLARDNLETNPIPIKPETASHVAEQSFWIPLPSCSPPGCPFPIKCLALSARVSPGTIHFRVLDESPLSGPGRDSPFLQPIYTRLFIVALLVISKDWEQLTVYQQGFRWIN